MVGTLLLGAAELVLPTLGALDVELAESGRTTGAEGGGSTGNFQR
jgi:hypothetical protein